MKDSKYEKWIKNEIKYSTDLGLTVIPLAGWLTSIYVFGFVYPITYLFKKYSGELK